MSVSDSFHFRLPTKIRFGAGARASIKEETERLLQNKKGRILVLSGKNSAKASGILDEIRKDLNRHSLIFKEGSIPNPSREFIQQEIDEAREERIDLVMGIGGGSVLDLAKAVALLVTGKQLLYDVLIKKRPPPKQRKLLIAIPTTSGTGSEVTPWSTIWDYQRKKKFSLHDSQLFPDVAIIDPELMLSLPRKITASTGMDALSHSIESCWSVEHNPMSTALALTAIRKIVRWLPIACRRPRNLDARIEMALASLMAGIAFSQTKTAAAHAISYALTLHHQVPHGIACSITLPSLLKVHSRIVPEVVAPIIEALGERSIEGASAKLKNLMEQMGLRSCLRSYGIAARDISRLAKEGIYPERMKQSPARLSARKIERILQEIY